VGRAFFEASFPSRFHPLVSTSSHVSPIRSAQPILGLAAAVQPARLRFFPAPGNGILTIARGTLPLAIFGPQITGYCLGIIGAPRGWPGRRTGAVQPADRHHG